MIQQTPIERFFDWLLGRKYYAVINERQAPFFSTEIMAYIFTSRREAEEYATTLVGNIEYNFYEVISFRSRKRMTNIKGKEI